MAEATARQTVRRSSRESLRKTMSALRAIFAAGGAENAIATFHSTGTSFDVDHFTRYSKVSAG